MEGKCCEFAVYQLIQVEFSMKIFRLAELVRKDSSSCKKLEKIKNRSYPVPDSLDFWSSGQLPHQNSVKSPWFDQLMNAKEIDLGGQFLLSFYIKVDKIAINEAHYGFRFFNSNAEGEVRIVAGRGESPSEEFAVEVESEFGVVFAEVVICKEIGYLKIYQLTGKLRFSWRKCPRFEN